MYGRKNKKNVTEIFSALFKLRAYDRQTGNRNEKCFNSHKTTDLEEFYRPLSRVWREDCPNARSFMPRSLTVFNETPNMLPFSRYGRLAFYTVYGQEFCPHG